MNETVVVIDYGSGNIRSAQKALERAAREHSLNTDVIVAHDPDVIKHADRIVLPGVGAFGDCAAGIRRVPGLEAEIIAHVKERARPFLGICVGMQLMAEEGLENGLHKGFGWVSGHVAKLHRKPDLKIPHMGWNRLVFDRPNHALLQRINDGDHAYFVHSYAMRPKDDDAQIAHTQHGQDITAIVQSGTAVGTQFHPEKSQKTGLLFLGNWLEWRP